MDKIVILLFFALLFLAACDGSNKKELVGAPASTLSPEAQAGKKVFEQNCSSCHSIIPGTVIVGPSLAGVAARAETRLAGKDAQEYLYASVLNPGDYLVEGFGNLMPASLAKQLTGEELDAVIAYLLTLQ